VWLLRMLETAAAGSAYNVGSAHPVSISELAHEVCKAAGVTLPVELAVDLAPGAPAPRYVPDVQKAFSELGLAEYTPLASALAKTVAWNR
jgi:nucleoside-diphosphate-sugar epimerase